MAQCLNIFETEQRPGRGTCYLDETKKPRHITRNATSEHKQTQLEDCFFYFLLLQTDKSKQSVSRTDVQTERMDSLCYSHNFFFLFPLFNLFLGIWFINFTSPAHRWDCKNKVNKVNLIKGQKKKKKKPQYEYIVVQSGEGSWEEDFLHVAGRIFSNLIGPGPIITES